MTPVATMDVISVVRVHLGATVLGLPASAVEEMVRAVAITPLADAPPIIEGVIDVRGTVVAVLDLRLRLGLPSRVLDPTQFLVLLRAGSRTMAVRVDEVDDVVELDRAAIRPGAGLSPALEHVAGVGVTADGVIVIHDPDTFITAAEDAALDSLLATRQ